jgi:hypothetical protein
VNFSANRKYPAAMSKCTLIYRKLFCRQGYHVHSPFVYDLITRVISEKRPYYFFREMNILRRQLLHAKTPVEWRGGRTTLGRAVRKYGISAKKGELMFRITNRYGCRTMLAIGSTLGLAPMYLTGYAEGLRCVVLEREAGFAAVANRLITADSPVSVCTGSSYDTMLPGALSGLGRVDFLFMSGQVEAAMLILLFERCVAYMHGETICMIDAIRTSAARYQCWRMLCSHPAATVSMDLYTCGMIFLRPGLPRRTYRSIV